jgi:predicted MFS family arabinose efflux permease
MAQFDLNWGRAILERSRQRRADRLRGLLIQPRRRDQASGACSRLPPSFTRIFLPFAFCYFLSYVFRTINGPLADELVQHFSLSGGSLGIITSTYFLAFALSAIPIGVALDALGPRLVQGWLMTVAAIGASVFALASSPLLLILGRFLIGIGVAGGLMAGLKAHALWVSPGRVPLGNGALVMFGGLGAIATTLPIEPTERTLGWRGIFVALALISMVIAALIFALVPRSVATDPEQRRAGAPNGLIGAIRDPRFVRIAPLSASVVGTAFAVHGLWAALWLTDVEGLPPAEVLHGLFAMGVGLTFGALLIGLADTWLSRIGASQVRIFGGFCLAYIALQALVLAHVGLPVSLLWDLIGGFGGMCVLSYSILGSMFSPALVGRANSALNVFHLTTAWAMQAAMGLVVAQWPADASGHYPLVAYRAAFILPLGLQIIAFIWYVVRAGIGACPRFPVHHTTADVP